MLQAAAEVDFLDPMVSSDFFFFEIIICSIVPNLAISRIVSRENNKVRILQVQARYC